MDEVFDSEISDTYTSFEFTSKGIMMYGKDEFRIVSEKGKEKYEGRFETEISQIVPLNSNEDYLFITIENDSLNSSRLFRYVNTVFIQLLGSDIDFVAPSYRSADMCLHE